MINKHKYFFSKNLSLITISFFCGVFFIIIASEILKQYDHYVTEANYLKKTIEIYTDRKILLKDKTSYELKELLYETNRNIDSILSIFPSNDYNDIIKIQNSFKRIANDYNINFSVLTIHKTNRDFYERLLFETNFVGDFSQIKRLLEKIDEMYPLISWEKACLNNVGKNQGFLVKFYFYLYKIENMDDFYKTPSCSDILRKTMSEHNKMELNTWLPPFSIWIKKLYQDTRVQNNLKSPMFLS